VKQRSTAIALLAAVLVMTALVGCAPPTANNPDPTPTPKPVATVTTDTPLPGDRIAARSFIDSNRGWAVGTSAGGGSLIQLTVDGGKHWTVQLRDDDHGLPLVGVSFVDELHGWAIASTGTLVGYVIATVDGGRTWHNQGGWGPLDSVHFTDALHGTIEGSDGDSPQHPITLTTTDGGRTWSASHPQPTRSEIQAHPAEENPL